MGLRGRVSECSRLVCNGFYHTAHYLSMNQANELRLDFITDDINIGPLNRIPSLQLLPTAPPPRIASNFLADGRLRILADMMYLSASCLEAPHYCASHSALPDRPNVLP